MKRLWGATAFVWILTLYPITELTRLILAWRSTYAPSGDWETVFELLFMWTLWLTVPVALRGFAQEVPNSAHFLGNCHFCPKSRAERGND